MLEPAGVGESDSTAGVKVWMIRQCNCYSACHSLTVWSSRPQAVGRSKPDQNRPESGAEQRKRRLVSISVRYSVLTTPALSMSIQ